MHFKANDVKIDELKAVEHMNASKSVIMDKEA